MVYLFFLSRSLALSRRLVVVNVVCIFAFASAKKCHEWVFAPAFYPWHSVCYAANVNEDNLAKPP